MTDTNSNLSTVTPQPADVPTAPPVALVWDTAHVMTYVTMILSALFMTNVIPTSGPFEKAAAVVAIILSDLGYKVTTSWVKTTNMKTNATLSTNRTMLAARFRAIQSESGFASVRVMAGMAVAAVAAAFWMFAGASCTKIKADATTMTGAFEMCAKADLGKVVTQTGITLLGDVAGLIESNGTNIEDDLTQLALQVGNDAVICAIQAVDAVVHAPTVVATGSGSGSGSASTPATTRPQISAPNLPAALGWKAKQTAARTKGAK